MGGENPVMFGSTLKPSELVSAVEPVVTVTGPVSAPNGTDAVMKFGVAVTVEVGVPPNLTTEELVNPWPKMPIWVPTFPEVICSNANGANPLSRK